MRWITFDCYGTLVDWRTGISQAIDAVAPGQAARLLPAYYEHEAEIERGPFRRYRTVMAEALRQAAHDAGVTLPADAGDILAERLPGSPVFPDVAPALGALQRDGWKLAVLSNIDRDLFAVTRANLPVTIDAVVTAEDVRSYKPAAAHFEEFVRRYTPEQHLHAAQSYYHDIRPAHSLGIPVVWINRLNEPRDASIADAVLPDLRRLPETAARLCP